MVEQILPNNNENATNIFFQKILDLNKALKYFLFHPSHRIFRRMHEALNIGKKITNCIVCL
jgi:hypothetical protein